MSAPGQGRQDSLIRQLQGTLKVRGQAAGTGTGVAFADVVVTDNLGTTSKQALGTHHAGGTYGADITVPVVLSTTTNTTTFRVNTRLGGNIPAGQTFFFDYWIWPA